MPHEDAIDIDAAYQAAYERIPADTPDECGYLNRFLDAAASRALLALDPWEGEPPTC